MGEPIKLAIFAAIGTIVGLSIVAELCGDDFMIHIISTYVIYDEIAGMVVGMLAGMSVYGLYAAFTRDHRIDNRAPSEPGSGTR
jgi:hypothetical protein